MKKTFTRTMFIEDLTKAEVRITVYDGCKYVKGTQVCNEATYTGVTSWDIISGGDEAKEVEAMTDENSLDEYNEYLVLHFADGSESTFCNSHVDMHIR